MKSALVLQGQNARKELLPIEGTFQFGYSPVLEIEVCRICRQHLLHKATFILSVY